MVESWEEEGFDIIKKNIVPVSVRMSENVDGIDELLKRKPACISFKMGSLVTFTKKGAYVVLDFGKELCGSIRLVTREVVCEPALFRITLGESLSEACSSIGVKNSTNDHSPRDITAMVTSMSDLTFGLSGFRFARVELLSESCVFIRNIFAVSMMTKFEREGYIKTSDEKLNKIIDTAIYTLKLCFQNGYIWDGIKRDRLVWCGDLNPEIITSLYLFGDNKNITNSLTFLKEETSEIEWINTIPTYSAWWCINLCDYCRITGNREYFEENKEYAKNIFVKMNQSISANGEMDFKLPPDAMSFYLDWPTYKTEDAVIGTASLFIYAAKRYLAIEDNKDCHEMIHKLQSYLAKPCEFKQVRAFQVLAGRTKDGDAFFMEKNGAHGFSTFMSYYILTADALAKGENMLTILKEYFGAMLSRGATTFWEDFHIEWLKDSGRIDEFPKEGERDIHGNYGAFCYEGFRHSLCHGWASGVLAFIYEYMLGLKLIDGGNYEVNPNPMGVKEIHAKVPTRTGWLEIDVVDGKVFVQIK